MFIAPVETVRNPEAALKTLFKNNLVSSGATSGYGLHMYSVPSMSGRV